MLFRSDTFQYCAVHLASIADNARDLDLAIRWGFGWNQGPFELWQGAGWSAVAQWIAADIKAGKALDTLKLDEEEMETARNPEPQIARTPEEPIQPLQEERIPSKRKVPALRARTKKAAFSAG